MRALAWFLILYSLPMAGQNLVVLGEISDSQCAFNVHSNGSSHDDALKTNILGRTAEDCTRSCVRLGGQFVLIDSVHKKVYHLANPSLAEPFAAKKVRVKGTLNNGDIFTISTIVLR